jgi:hypothetical protein
MNKIYYIESLVLNEDDMYVAILSCGRHHNCIEVYGNEHECTDRVMKILKGLNGE